MDEFKDGGTCDKFENPNPTRLEDRGGGTKGRMASS